MPLSVLGPLVVFGLLAVALTIRLLGVSHPFVFRSEDDVRRALARHMPARVGGAVLIAQDGRCALVETDAGGVLIWAFGADTVARGLAGAAAKPNRRGLRVDLHSFASPGPRLRLTAEERPLWQEKIKEFAA